MSLFDAAMRKCDDCGREGGLSWWGPNIRICGACHSARGSYTPAAQRQPAPTAPIAGLPEEPTREMWAAMGDAIVGLQARGIGHHDAIAGAVYRAIRATLATQQADA